MMLCVSGPSWWVSDRCCCCRVCLFEFHDRFEELFEGMPKFCLVNGY